MRTVRVLVVVRAGAPRGSSGGPRSQPRSVRNSRPVAMAAPAGTEVNSSHLHEGARRGRRHIVSGQQQTLALNRTVGQHDVEARRSSQRRR